MPYELSGFCKSKHDVPDMGARVVIFCLKDRAWIALRSCKLAILVDTTQQKQEEQNRRSFVPESLL